MPSLLPIVTGLGGFATERRGLAINSAGTYLAPYSAAVTEPAIKSESGDRTAANKGFEPQPDHDTQPTG